MVRSTTADGRLDDDYPAQPAAVVLFVSALLAACAVAPVVSAHGLPLEVSDLMFDTGELVGMGTNYGLLTYEDEAWLWVGNETLGSTALWYHRSPDGRVLAGAFPGIKQTSDGGCSWTAVRSDELAAHIVAAIAADPDDPTHLFVVTNSSGMDNGLFESADGGVSWSATALSVAGTRLRNVVVWPGAQTLVVTGMHALSGAPMASRTTDGGQTFETPAADLSSFVEVRALGLADGELVLAVDAAGQQSLASSGDLLDSLSLGASFGVGRVLEHEVFGSDRFVITAQPDTSRQLWRSRAGATFQGAAGPTRCLDTVGDRLWGCGWVEDEAHFLWSDDGLDWSTGLAFDRVCPRSCPAGTPGAEQDPSVWQDFNLDGVGNRCGEGDGDLEAHADGGVLVGGGDGDGDGEGSRGGDGDGSGDAADAAVETGMPDVGGADAGCGCRVVGTATRAPGPSTAAWVLPAIAALAWRRRRWRCHNHVLIALKAWLSAC